MNIRAIVLLACMAYFGGNQNLTATPVEILSYDELMEHSDVVVIAKPISILPIGTRSDELAIPENYSDVLAISVASFSLSKIVKGASADEFSVVFFTYNKDTKVVLKPRPKVPSFRLGVQSFQGNGWAAALELEYLLFLKRMPGGRFILLGTADQMHQSVRVVVPVF